MASSSSEKIGVRTAVIIGVNTMIGAGIFGTSALLGSNVGPAGIITYLIAFSAVWFIAQSFARVAYLYPQEGSFYNYSKQWGGHYLGLACAGAYICGLLTAMGLLSKIASGYLHNIVPSISMLNWSLIVVTTLTALNLSGAVLSSIGQYILIILTLYPVFLTTLLCLSNIDSANLTPFMPHGWPSVIHATKVAMFGLFGFEGIASLFNIMENPERNVPRALRLSMIIVGLIYLLFIGSILLGIPQTVFQEYPNITIAQALQTVFPEHELLIQSMGISIIFSILGTVHAVIWAASELILSYFKVLRCSWTKKMISTGIITQKTTALLAGIVILTACLTINNLSVFFSLTNICLLFAFICSITTLLFVRQEWKSGQNYITVLGLVSAVGIFAIAFQSLINSLMA